jgi:N-succinyldiaminopimelate aminotransferase
MAAFPERFSNLPEYAFPRLRGLLDAHTPGGPVIAMTIGEPQHPQPDFVARVLAENIVGFGKYPINDGTPALLQTISGWIARRYSVTLDPATQMMALNGTREGLFNALIALCPETKAGARPLVLTPNPFYPVYAVAALAVGAEPYYVPATAASGFLPDYASLPVAVLDQVAVAYICSPSNPQGAVAPASYLRTLIGLAEKHDFLIFADECYAEIFRDDPPPGILQVAADMGADPERVFSFHSLSKRSNLPGLRSGFVAGGRAGMAQIKQLRNYAGAPLPLPLQEIARHAWADETHVIENRALYRAKFELADEIFAGIQGYRPPEAGFFLWLPVENGEAACLDLWQRTGVRVLPGAYLGHGVGHENPGHGYIRVAMVAPIDECRDGLLRLRDCIYA